MFRIARKRHYKIFFGNQTVYSVAFAFRTELNAGFDVLYVIYSHVDKIKHAYIIYFSFKIITLPFFCAEFDKIESAVDLCRTQNPIGGIGQGKRDSATVTNFNRSFRILLGVVIKCSFPTAHMAPVFCSGMKHACVVKHKPDSAAIPVWHNKKIIGFICSSAVVDRSTVLVIYTYISVAVIM